MIGEDHRLVGGEERVEFAVGQAVRVLPVVLQPHQVDDVDEPHLQLRQPLAQDAGRGQRLEGRHVARAGDHDVGVVALV